MLAVPLAAVYIGGTGVSEASAEDGKTFDYTCDADAPVVGEMEVDMEVEVNGEAPDKVEPGEEFEIENSYTNVTILDTSTMKVAMDELEGQVTTFNLESDNEEETINVADDPLTIPATELPDDSDEVTFKVPTDGLTAESYTAGDEGEIEISAGQVDNTLESDLGSIEATCSTDFDDTVVNTIEIEDDESEEPEESTVTATYVDEDGDEIADSEEFTGEVGDSYETEEKEIDGYEFVEVDGEESGEYGEDDATVEYVYEEESEEAEESTVTVTYVDEDGEEIEDSEELTGEVGETYESEQKDIDGYEFVEVNGEEEGEYGEDDATVEYVYEEESEEEEESTVTVTYVDEDGEEIEDSEELTGEV